MKLRLPDVTGDLPGVSEGCLICGAVPTEPGALEMRLPDGMISMSVERDLCLECAIHLWRGIKELYGNGAVRFHAYEVLRRYSVTAAALRRQCRTDREGSVSE